MKLKNILSNAFDAIISSYEGKRFWPSLILRLVMALASAVITAVFANTLFSKNNIVNQIFAALFFYFLMVSVSKLITEIKRGGFGKRLKTTVCNMVRLKPPALWFFIAAVVIALFLPYAFVLSLALLLFCSAVSENNSLLLGIKNAVTKGKNPERSGKGLAAFTSGLIACGLIICILTNLGVPTLYGVIDGSNPKPGTTQTEPAGKDDGSQAPSDTDQTSGIPIKPSGDDTKEKDDADITEAAKQLTDKLIEYAGKDKKEFKKLFRNTDDSVIDQYYNTSYDKFREYGKSLIAVAAKDKDSVWFTALYYQIPENYPAEKEKSVYLSTIMTRADDGWKLEWNDDVRSKLQAKYDEAGFTFDGLSAKEDGRAWAKFFIPFDLNNTEIFYEDAVMCKVTEMYIDTNDNLQLTVYASNGTDKAVKLTGVDITVADGDQKLFEKHFDINFDIAVEKDSKTLYTLTLFSPQDINLTTWNRPKITDFSFSYENQ
jgi:hypothetical protein